MLFVIKNLITTPMALGTRYNLKSPGVKRLMREASELAAPTEEYSACPLEDNLFEWHFTVRGPPNTEFEGGLYHGRILLPSQYPMQPPNIILLTPNGRFETNKKICLSISGHHPESWQPSWSIRTALLALIAFMPTPAAGTIGSLDYTKEERQILAKKSRGFECHVCGNIANKLSIADATDDQESKTPQPLTKEESCLLSQIALKSEEETAKTQTQGTEKNTEVRQRQIELREHEEVTEEATVTIPVSVRPNQDRILTTVAWVVVVLIVLLAIRRIFYV